MGGFAGKAYQGAQAGGEVMMVGQGFQRAGPMLVHEERHDCRMLNRCGLLLV